VRALVAGGGGQLGRDLVAALGPDLAWAGGRAELDIADAAAIDAVFRRVRPDVVFNAAAYNKVDGAESEVGRALEVNALGPSLLARAARAANALLVHFSTDYVFDGSAARPYREDDCPRPLGAYGASKLAGEHMVASARGQSLVIRTSAVFGRGGNRQKGGSFVERILDQARAGRPLRVVSDQMFSPTYSPDLGAAAVALVQAGARGLVHVSGGGACSWHELAVAALGLAGVEAPVEAVQAADLNLAASRPPYSVLDNGRYQGFGLPAMRPWRDALSASLGRSLTLPPRIE
jgi:dTDP-4-dehydrorhamnose reductase